MRRKAKLCLRSVRMIDVRLYQGRADLPNVPPNRQVCHDDSL